MNYDRVILELLDRVSALEDEIEKLKKQQSLSITDAESSDVSTSNEGSKESLTFSQLFENNNQSGNGRDTTKYIFDGKRYGKNRLVLAIVQKYVKSVNQPTVGMLTRTFDRSLQGSLGVVRKYNDVKKNYSDYERRFFCQPNEIIHTVDGDCVVCTQWGKFNIDNIIARAKQLGMEIIEI